MLRGEVNTTMQKMIASIVATMIDCVTHRRAAAVLRLVKRIEQTTEQPMPIMIPMPDINSQIGAEMLTAATPSGPTPYPTNMPSTTVTVDMAIVPIRVGIARL